MAEPTAFSKRLLNVFAITLNTLSVVAILVLIVGVIFSVKYHSFSGALMQGLLMLLVVLVANYLVLSNAGIWNRINGSELPRSAP